MGHRRAAQDSDHPAPDPNRPPTPRPSDAHEPPPGPKHPAVAAPPTRAEGTAHAENTAQAEITAQAENTAQAEVTARAKDTAPAEVTAQAMNAPEASSGAERSASVPDEPRSTVRSLLRLWPYVRPVRARLGTAAAVAVIASCTGLVVPLILKWIVDGPVAHGGGAGVWWGGALLLAVGLAEAGLFGLRRWLVARPLAGVEAAMRAALFGRLQRLPVAFHDRWAGGQLLSRATTDLQLLRIFFAFPLTFLFVNGATVLVGCVILLVQKWTLGLVLLAPVVPLVVLCSVFEARYALAARRAQDQLGDLTTVIEESLLGIRVIKGFGRHRSQARAFRALSERLLDTELHKARLLARLWALITTLPEIALGAALVLGTVQVADGALSAGTLVAFLSTALALRWPVESIGFLLALSNEAATATDRFFDVMAAPVPPDTGPTAPTTPGTPAAPGAPPRTPGTPGTPDAPRAPDAPARSGLRFEGVVFRYPGGPPGEPPVLDGVDLHIRPGETMALVGATGSGKTTLTALVPRLHEVTAGRILLDGVDVAELPREQLRTAVAVAFEEPTLFSTTVRENVLMGHPDGADGAEPGALERALRVARADGFVAALPHGAGTQVGEQGLSLSGGQRQRLALARAVVGRPRFLVLDDPLSALDVHTEAAVEAALREVLASTTALVVAHRPSTVQLADRVALLSDGRITAVGTHDELLRTDPRYRTLMSGTAAGTDGTAATNGTGGAHGTDSTDTTDSTDGTGGAAGRTRARTTGGAPAEGPGETGTDSGQNTGAGAPQGGSTNAPQRRSMDTSQGGSTDAPQGASADVPQSTSPGGPEGTGAPDPFADDVLPTPKGASRRLLATLLRPRRRGVALAALLLCLQQAAVQAGPLLVAFALDRALPALRDGGYGPLVAVAAGYLLCALAAGWFQHGFVLAAARVTQRALLELRARIQRHAQRLDVDFHDRYTSGRLVSRATTDVESLRELLDKGLQELLTVVLSTVYILVTLLWLDVGLGAAAVASFVPLGLLVRNYRRRVLRVHRRRSTAMARVVVAFAETMNGIRPVQTFRRERANDARFAELNGRHRRTNGDGLLEMARYVVLARGVANVAVAALVVWGALRVASGGLELGVLAAAALYLRRLYDPIDRLGMFLNSYQAAAASLEKIAGLLAQEPSVPEPVRPRPLPSRGGGPPGREAVFEAVSFGYRTGGEVLPRFDLTVPAGQTVAVVGATGAGKSTLAKLLARFYDPSAGRVLLDGTDLRELEAAELRRAVVMVTQEAFLFSGTVADNIALGRPDASRAEVEAAAKAIGAHDFIAALPDGYDTDVRKRGGRISAGQRQLVSFARALLADPAVLILDEATSSLDVPGERAVQAAMATVLRGRTAVVIAHRLSTVEIADRVLVMADGRVVEDGPPAELVAADGRFARLDRAWRDSLSRSLSGA